MTEQRLLSRQAWVSASRFHAITEAEVLREVAKRVTRLRAERPDFKPPHPLVVLDLDSTLYEVAPRTFRIVTEWRESADSAPFESVRRAIDGMRESHIGYSIKDTLRNLGLDPADKDILNAGQRLKAFWLERFFTSQYLVHDRPYEGAASFARELYAIGAELVYLTGRDEPSMGEGTRRNLLRDGFPWEVERTHAMLKPSLDLTDLEHKKRAADWLRGHGELVASFENEPLNLVALYERFPDAMHIFVDTVCSDREAAVVEGLYRIRGFAALEPLGLPPERA